MTYLEVSRIVFWVFVFTLLTVSTVWVVLKERQDDHLEALAQEHRDRRFREANREIVCEMIPRVDIPTKS